MFTQPLARSQDFGKLVKASEGATNEASKPLEARWVLGDNPRIPRPLFAVLGEAGQDDPLEAPGSQLRASCRRRLRPAARREHSTNRLRRIGHRS
jgi:hypothetical protein